MRTTLHIDDDVYRAARSIAESEGKTIGEVMSDLARKALAPRKYETDEEGIPAFVVSERAAPLTMQMVAEALEQE